MAILYGAGCALLLLVCFRQTRELGLEKDARPSTPASLRNIRSWCFLCAATVCSLAAFGYRASLGVFFARTVSDRSEVVGALLASSSAAALLACSAYPLLPTRVRRQPLLLVLSPAGAAVSALFLISKPDALALNFTLQILFGLVTGTVVALLFAAFADLANAKEDFVSAPVNGLLAASAVITVKLGPALGSSFVSLALQRLGYQRVAHPETYMSINIQKLFAVVPAVFLAVSTLLVAGFLSSLERATADTSASSVKTDHA